MYIVKCKCKTPNEFFLSMVVPASPSYLKIKEKSRLINSSERNKERTKVEGCENEINKGRICEVIGVVILGTGPLKMSSLEGVSLRSALRRYTPRDKDERGLRYSNHGREPMFDDSVSFPRKISALSVRRVRGERVSIPTLLRVVK